MSLYDDLVAAGGTDPRELVLVERGDGHTATVTLNDPDHLNKLSAPLVLQLREHLATLTADPGVRTVVLRGAGRAFSAGGDLDMITDGGRQIRDALDPSDASDAWRWIRGQFGAVVRLIAGSDTIFVAQLTGVAAGVGLAFALACDVLVATEDAVLVPAFGRLGLVPEVGTSWLLTRRLGYHDAMAWYLTGAHLDATEALRRGLVQEVCARSEVDTVTDRWCALVAGAPVHAVRMSKTLLRGAADASWEQSLSLEEFAEATCFTTDSLGRAAASIRGR